MLPAVVASEPSFLPRAGNFALIGGSPARRDAEGLLGGFLGPPGALVLLLDRYLSVRPGSWLTG